MATNPTPNINPNRAPDRPSSVPKINQLILEAEQIAETIDKMFTDSIRQAAESQEQVNASLEELGVTISPATSPALPIEPASTYNEIPDKSLSDEEFDRLIEQQIREADQAADAIEALLEQDIQNCELRHMEVENWVDQLRKKVPIKEKNPQNIFWLAIASFLFFGMSALISHRIHVIKQ
jgi:hypothetical protein